MTARAVRVMVTKDGETAPWFRACWAQECYPKFAGDRSAEGDANTWHEAMTAAAQHIHTHHRGDQS